MAADPLSHFKTNPPSPQPDRMGAQRGRYNAQRMSGTLWRRPWHFPRGGRPRRTTMLSIINSVENFDRHFDRHPKCIDLSFYFEAILILASKITLQRIDISKYFCSAWVVKKGPPSDRTISACVRLQRSGPHPGHHVLFVLRVAGGGGRTFHACDGAPALAPQPCSFFL